MRTPMVLDAIEMARWNRGLHHPDLRCHSDAGSQFTIDSLRRAARGDRRDHRRSDRSATAYDNALAETVNGYYKAELIRGPARTGPWKTVEEVELATLGWVHWHNTQRLHGYLGDLPPAEFEQLHATRLAQDPDPGVLSVAPAGSQARRTPPTASTPARSKREIAAEQPISGPPDGRDRAGHRAPVARGGAPGTEQWLTDNNINTHNDTRHRD